MTTYIELKAAEVTKHLLPGDEEKQTLTTLPGIQSLMRTSKSEAEWNNNCDRVKQANDNDYPSFWFSGIILSGIMTEARSSW
ncbi:MAG: hypothetical protein ACRCWR_02540 [Saezia sp.]